jgi:hypothetical protein
MVAGGQPAASRAHAKPTRGIWKLHLHASASGMSERRRPRWRVAVSCDMRHFFCVFKKQGPGLTLLPVALETKIQALRLVEGDGLVRGAKEKLNGQGTELIATLAGLEPERFNHGEVPPHRHGTTESRSSRKKSE